MLRKLYEHFKELYANILELQPTLASEHAVLQEQEIYSGATKHTYRNVPKVIASIVMK